MLDHVVALLKTTTATVASAIRRAISRIIEVIRQARARHLELAAHDAAYAAAVAAVVGWAIRFVSWQDALAAVLTAVIGICVTDHRRPPASAPRSSSVELWPIE